MFKTVTYQMRLQDGNIISNTCSWHCMKYVLKTVTSCQICVQDGDILLNRFSRRRHLKHVFPLNIIFIVIRTNFGLKTINLEYIAIVNGGNLINFILRCIFFIIDFQYFLSPGRVWLCCGSLCGLRCSWGKYCQVTSSAGQLPEAAPSPIAWDSLDR